MPDDITKGALVRVIAAGLYIGQICPVLSIDSIGSWQRFLLDLRAFHRPHAKPRWFERHEIERVEVEREAQG